VAKGTFGGGYTARAVAKLLGLTPAQIRAYVRGGFLDPPRGPKGEQRFALPDIVLLRTAKALEGRLPPRKVRRALARLREQLPSGRPLTGVRITAEGDDVVVRDGGELWEAESGQRLLDFEVSELASRVAPLARRAAEAARDAEEELAAEDWYAIGFDLEPCDPDQARDAYRRALELDPRHADARVNLGRLLHEAGHAAAAEQHYRLALAVRPKDATAAFNLGVALEDLERPAEALEAYERALTADSRNADAHYNAARLCERMERKAAALRHLKAYRALTRT
jgi:tetratricopeptide (TPR) repeat protein